MGYMLESLDSEAFADALEKLIENPKMSENTAQCNREYARERFTASRVAKRIELIYGEILRV